MLTRASLLALAKSIVTKLIGPLPDYDLLFIVSPFYFEAFFKRDNLFYDVFFYPPIFSQRV